MKKIELEKEFLKNQRDMIKTNSGVANALHGIKDAIKEVNETNRLHRASFIELKGAVISSNKLFYIAFILLLAAIIILAGVEKLPNLIKYL